VGEEVPFKAGEKTGKRPKGGREVYERNRRAGQALTLYGSSTVLSERLETGRALGKIEDARGREKERGQVYRRQQRTGSHRKSAREDNESIL